MPCRDFPAVSSLFPSEQKHAETPCYAGPVCRVLGRHRGALVCLCCEHSRLRKGFTWDGSKEEIVVVAKSSFVAQNQKACRYFLEWLTGFITGMLGKTLHSQTVIQHIPGFNTHTALISLERSGERGEKQKYVVFFMYVSWGKWGPVCTAAGTEMHRDSFQLITSQNILVIERQWKSEAKLAVEVITARG